MGDQLFQRGSYIQLTCKIYVPQGLNISKCKLGEGSKFLNDRTFCTRAKCLGGGGDIVP